MHLRPPSIAFGVRAFLWALLLAVYVWAFLLAIGVSNGVAAVIGAVCLFAFFVFVRVYGEDEMRTRRRPVRPRS